MINFERRAVELQVNSVREVRFLVVLLRIATVEFGNRRLDARSRFGVEDLSEF